MSPATPATTLADRALLRLSGEDVRGFLQGLVTNDVSGALPVWAGLLTPQGKCLFDFIIWADGDDLLLDCEAEAADDLAKRLTLYRLRRPIRIEREEGLAVIGRPRTRRAWRILAFLRLVGAGSRLRLLPRQPGSTTVCAWAYAKVGPSLATCSGSSATRPNSMASASPRAATSARRIPPE